MKANIQWHTQRINAIQNVISGAGGAFTFFIYKGTMPTASMPAVTPSTYSGQLLLQYTATNAFGVTADNYQRLLLTTLPSAVAASASGTATWFALSNTTGSPYTYTLWGDVTDTNGAGALKMLTTSIVAATSYQIYSFGFSISQ